MKLYATNLTLKSVLLALTLIAGAANGFGQECPYKAQVVSCSSGSTNTVPNYIFTPPSSTTPTLVAVTVTVDSPGTGNSCEGDEFGDAPTQVDFPDDQCNYMETVTTTYVIGTIVTEGPTQMSSSFDGHTCKGYCGG